MTSLLPFLVLKPSPHISSADKSVHFHNDIDNLERNIVVDAKTPSPIVFELFQGLVGEMYGFLPEIDHAKDVSS